MSRLQPIITHLSSKNGKDSTLKMACGEDHSMPKEVQCERLQNQTTRPPAVRSRNKRRVHRFRPLEHGLKSLLTNLSTESGKVSIHVEAAYRPIRAV